MKSKKIIVIPSSQGCLGKNKGTEKAGENICKSMGINYTIAEISESDFIETTKKLEKLEGDIFVGGDHSITYPLFKNSKADGLIIFDAHADCVNNFSPPTHEDFVRVLVEEKIVSPDKILIIGLRNVDPIEKEYLKDKKINYINMKKCNVGNVQEKIENFLKKVENVYLSVDFDVLDSSIASATGYPEKDGMQVEDLLNYIKQIKDSNKVVRSDFVEYNPIKDKEKKELEICKEIVEVLK
jgi:arginase family enzyme